jgi:hypothetical protein
LSVAACPWEPPLAGTDLEHLVGASALTLGGLLQHLAWVEDFTFVTKLHGERLGAPWDARDGRDDWGFTSASDDTPDELYAGWDAAVERSRARLDAAVAAGGLDLREAVDGLVGEDPPPGWRAGS